MSAHTNKFDTTPRQLKRSHQLERWMIRICFGGPVIVLMVISFLGGRLS